VLGGGRPLVTLVLALFLLIAWIVAVAVLKVAGAFIHLLLIVALVAFVFHALRRTRRPTSS
jgi:uncharacterized protein DUF5670